MPRNFRQGSAHWILRRNKEILVIPDGICVISPDYTVVTFNQAAERITGYEARTVVGNHISVLFPDTDDGEDYVGDALRQGEPYSNLWLDIVCADGTVKNVLASITPLWKNSDTVRRRRLQ